MDSGCLRLIFQYGQAYIPGYVGPLLPEPLPVVAPLLLEVLLDGPDVPAPPEPDELLIPDALLPDEPLKPAPPPAPELPLLWAKAEPASIAADTNNAIDNLFMLCSLISGR